MVRTERVKYVLVLMIVVFINLYSQSDELFLTKVDELASYPDVDFSSTYTFVESESDGVRNKTVAKVYRRDVEEKYVIIVEEPNINRGQGYLKVQNTLWFYDPESRRFNFSSAKDRFQNTSTRNSDFTKSTLASDYTIMSSEQTILGKYNCRLLYLEANNDEVTYPSCRIWIDEDSLIRKKEDYSLSGQLLRVSIFPSYQLVSNRHIPYQFLVMETLTQKKTQVTIDKVSFSPLPDSQFSKQFLERAGQ